jgi:DNA-binding response OmpR family regulator
MSARVRLEIVSTPAAVAKYRLGACTVSVDWSRKTVTQGGRSVALSPTEFRLFATLLGAEGRWISCDAIVRQVWPTDISSDTEKRLRVNICYLRKRLTSIGATGALITGAGSYRTALQEIQAARDVRVGRNRR